MKVYYNESCSICRAEINLYKKQNIKEIEWIEDIDVQREEGENGEKKIKIQVKWQN